jgi:hypothetical protein
LNGNVSARHFRTNYDEGVRVKLMLRRIAAVLALAAGIGLTTGTAVASAATPSSHPAVAITNRPVAPSFADWWW